MIALKYYRSFETMNRLAALSLLIAFGLVAGRSFAADAPEQKKIVFVAGNPSHGFGAHEHKAGCMLLAKYLNDNVPSVHAVVTLNGWPKDPAIFDGASAVIMYCDGGGGHMVVPHLKELDALNDKGV